MAKTQTAETKSPKGKRLKDLNLTKTDKPEYIKAEVLSTVPAFTIYGASRAKGRFGDIIRFLIAYKDGEAIEKKVYTPTANEDREQLMYEVLKNKAITNCRLVNLNIGSGQTYWKIIDADDAIPESEYGQEPTLKDDDIPF